MVLAGAVTLDVPLKVPKRAGEPDRERVQVGCLVEKRTTNQAVLKEEKQFPTGTGSAVALCDCVTRSAWRGNLQTRRSGDSWVGLGWLVVHLCRGSWRDKGLGSRPLPSSRADEIGRSNGGKPSKS